MVLYKIGIVGDDPKVNMPCRQCVLVGLNPKYVLLRKHMGIFGYDILGMFIIRSITGFEFLEPIEKQNGRNQF